jgi:PAS domain S-box-containing protein
VADQASPLVLIVEDESIVAHDIHQTLAASGYRPLEIAASAEEALGRASAQCPDVVLMDIRIKGSTDGLATARLLQDRFDVPIVYLTAHADVATIEKARETHPQAYLLKPVRAAELRAAIELAVHNHGMTRKKEAALRESEDRFRFVANTAPMMIWMSGPDKLYMYFNQGWLDFTGRSIEAELGNGWAEGVHAGDLERYQNSYTKAFDAREPFQMEFRFRRHDGAYRWIFNQGVPRFSGDGARDVVVSIKGGSHRVELTVHHSGTGFEPGEAIKGPGLGLTGMKKRLKLVRGELSIDSKPQGGTTIRARVPLRMRI